MFFFKNRNISKFFDVKLDRFFLKMSDPNEKRHSTAAELGIDVLYFKNRRNQASRLNVGNIDAFTFRSLFKLSGFQPSISRASLVGKCCNSRGACKSCHTTYHKFIVLYSVHDYNLKNTNTNSKYSIDGQVNAKR